MAEQRMCVARTASGEPCRNYAIEGADRCAPHLNLTGRKTTLTVELIDRIATYVRAGNHVTVACVAVGIPKDTFKGWWRKGAPGESERDADVLYRLLRSRVAQAEAEGEVRLASLLTAEAAENAAWAAWLLERKWPDRWARVSQRGDVEETVDEDDPFREVDQLAEQRRKRIGLDG